MSGMEQNEKSHHTRREVTHQGQIVEGTVGEGPKFVTKISCFILYDSLNRFNINI